MKKILFILIVICAFSFSVSAKDIDVENELYISSQATKMADVANDSIKEFDFENLTKIIKTKNDLFKPKSIVTKILNTFFEEINHNLHVMFLLIVLSIIWGLVSNIQSSYNSKSVSQTAFFAFYPIFLGLIISGLKECMELAHTTISDQVLFMKVSIPVYTALSMSSGNVAAATNMEPVFLYFIQLIGTFLEKFILQLVFWISVLNMINCMTDKFSIKKLIDFIKQSIKWFLGIIMTLFIGILSMSGIATSITDGLGIKTLKFAVGNFIPVVGGLLSDSVSTVISSISILKNTLGIAGVITIVLMCITPIIKMISLIAIYKLAAGLVEPICDKRITNMISESGNALTFILLILLSVTIMFILGITITISLGSNY